MSLQMAKKLMKWNCYSANGVLEIESKMKSGLEHSTRACFNKPFEIDYLVSCIHDTLKNSAKN